MFLNGFKEVQNLIQIALKYLFFKKKLQKSPSDMGFCFQNLFCDTLELSQFAQQPPNF